MNNNFMQDEIFRAMSRDIRTTSSYAHGYMDTVERGEIDAHLLKDITIDEDRYIETAKSTHMAGNPIFSKIKKLFTRKTAEVELEEDEVNTL